MLKVRQYTVSLFTSGELSSSMVILEGSWSEALKPDPGKQTGTVVRSQKQQKKIAKINF